MDVGCISSIFPRISSYNDDFPGPNHLPRPNLGGHWHIRPPAEKHMPPEASIVRNIINYSMGFLSNLADVNDSTYTTARCLWYRFGRASLRAAVSRSSAARMAADCGAPRGSSTTCWCHEVRGAGWMHGIGAAQCWAIWAAQCWAGHVEWIRVG